MRRSLPRVGRRRSPRQAADAADGRPQRPLTRADADGRAVDLVAAVEHLEAGDAAARKEDAQRAAVVLVDRGRPGTVQARRLTENAAHLVRLHPEPGEVDALTRHDSRRGRNDEAGRRRPLNRVVRALVGLGRAGRSRRHRRNVDVPRAGREAVAGRPGRLPRVERRLLVCIPPEGVRIRGDRADELDRVGGRAGHKRPGDGRLAVLHSNNGSRGRRRSGGYRGNRRKRRDGQRSYEQFHQIPVRPRTVDCSAGSGRLQPLVRTGIIWPCPRRARRLHRLGSSPTRRAGRRPPLPRRRHP